MAWKAIYSKFINIFWLHRWSFGGKNFICYAIRIFYFYLWPIIDARKHCLFSFSLLFNKQTNQKSPINWSKLKFISLILACNSSHLTFEESNQINLDLNIGPIYFPIDVHMLAHVTLNVPNINLESTKK